MGIIDGPSPRFVTADTVTLISADGRHDDNEETSNSSLQIPILQNEELTSLEPHSAPLSESE